MTKVTIQTAIVTGAPGGIGTLSTSKEGAGNTLYVVQQNPTNAPEWRPLRRQ